MTSSPVPGWLDRLAERSVVGSFTSLGYRLRAPGFCPLPRLEGQRILVTGATSGLGLALAGQLLHLGAEVCLVGRSPEKLRVAAGQVGTPHFERCDLSDLDDVRDLAARLARSFTRLHGLVHNAGILLDRRVLTPQGFEQAHATHLLAPYLLSCELLPLLMPESSAEQAQTRIVWVSSGGMYTQRFDPDMCEALRGKYDGVVAYAQQKRGQVLLQEAMQRHASKCGIANYAMHPGWADTPGVARSLPRFYKLTKPLLRSPDEGADTISWLLAGQAPPGQEGGFFLDRQARAKDRSRRFRHSAQHAEQVLTRCAELTGVDWREKCANASS